MRDLSKLALIYSHNGYWRKNQGGYTNCMGHAGIYDRQEAEKLAAGCGPEKGVQLCPVHEDHPVIMAEERLEAANGLLRRGERCVVKLREIAHRMGWNGVDNSKILEVFLDEYFNSITIERDELRAEAERLRERGDGFRTNMLSASLECDEARAAAVDLAKKVATLRTAMFEVRQHAAPSGIDRGNSAIEAIAVKALEETNANTPLA